MKTKSSIVTAVLIFELTAHILLLNIQTAYTAHCSKLSVNIFLEPVINIIQKLHFSKFPKDHITSKYLYLNRTGLPKNKCEYIMPDGTAVYNRITLSHDMFFYEYYIYELNDTFFSCYYAGYVTEQILYYMDNHTKKSESVRKIKGSFDKVIAVSQDSRYFGDILFGVSRIICFPARIFQNSVVTTNCKLGEYVASQVLNILGAENYKIEQISPYIVDVYYAKKLFTILPDFPESTMGHIKMGRSFQGPITIRFGNFMREKCKAIENPTKMILYNRRGKIRVFTDNSFNIFAETVQKNFPKYKFEIMRCENLSMIDTCKVFSSIRWIFIVAGSNAMNIIYMKPGGGICIFLTNTFDGATISCAVCRDLISVAFMNIEISHIGTTKLELNITKVMPYVTRSISAWEQGHL